MKQIKFTRSLVREVSSRVEKFTENRFGLQTGTDIGNGVRYIDNHSHKVWFGPEGAREACAYLIGGALGWACSEGLTLPDDDVVFLRGVQDAYSTKQRYRNWEQQGRERAEYLAGANR